MPLLGRTPVWCIACKQSPECRTHASRIAGGGGCARLLLRVPRPAAAAPRGTALPPLQHGRAAGAPCWPRWRQGECGRKLLHRWVVAVGGEGRRLQVTALAGREVAKRARLGLALPAHPLASAFWRCSGVATGRWRELPPWRTKDQWGGTRLTWIQIPQDETLFDPRPSGHARGSTQSKQATS